MRHIVIFFTLAMLIILSTNSVIFAQSEVPSFPNNTSGLTDPATSDYSSDIFSDFSGSSSSSSSSSGAAAVATTGSDSTLTTTDTTTNTTTDATATQGTTTVADTESGPATVIIYWMTFIMSFGLLSVYWGRIKRSLG